MTAAELIERLKELPPDEELFILPHPEYPNWKSSVSNIVDMDGYLVLAQWREYRPTEPYLILRRYAAVLSSMGVKAEVRVDTSCGVDDVVSLEFDGHSFSFFHATRRSYPVMYGLFEPYVVANSRQEFFRILRDHISSTLRKG